jgi:hypothetical protein
MFVTTRSGNVAADAGDIDTVVHVAPASKAAANVAEVPVSNLLSFFDFVVRGVGVCILVVLVQSK